MDSYKRRSVANVRRLILHMSRDGLRSSAPMGETDERLRSVSVNTDGRGTRAHRAELSLCTAPNWSWKANRDYRLRVAGDYAFGGGSSGESERDAGTVSTMAMRVSGAETCAATPWAAVIVKAAAHGVID